jgi:uncharacterized OB-fold protein
MAEEYRIMKAQVVVPYELALGGTWSYFFDCLKEERIMGKKCKSCKRVFVPPRSFCPRCFEDMEQWVEVKQEGTIETWVLVNMPFFAQQLKIPFISAQIRLDGSDTGFIHQIAGIDLSNFDKVREVVKLGGKVRAVWSKEKKGNILDIAYFEPLP